MTPSSSSCRLRKQFINALPILKQLLPYLLAVVLVAEGRTNLDAMINTFYWQPWREWYGSVWHLTPWLHIDWWISFYFAGILPLAAGSFILGWLLRNSSPSHRS